ncbi:hypothetical protein VTK26DRAFT_22 [Humicola hyalothermophila]
MAPEAHVPPSPPPEGENTLSPVRKRKQWSNDESNYDDNEIKYENISPRRSKKRKISTESMDLSDPQQLLLPGPESPVTAGPTDADSPAPIRYGEPANKPKRGVNNSLRPISDVREMFEDMVERLNPALLREHPVNLSVATLCSGTDAPIFALKLIQEALQTMGFGSVLGFKHLFSCEIEPFKQGFIRRNLPEGTIIFRDVVELACSEDKATTAGGSKVKIPTEQLDILFAGCSCVDYSTMNQNKPEGTVESLYAHLKPQPEMDRSEASSKEKPGRVGLDKAFIEALDAALSEPRGLMAAGESAITFFAALRLIVTKRPKVVILENVYGAPWDMYTDQIFPKVGYVARCVKLDSKDFYLPQTRQRGYLVAIDAEDMGEEVADEMATHWATVLSECKRPASTSISAFLRPADDPATIQARADMESKGSNNSDWALCSLRHNDARRKNGLRRDDNPFSLKAMRNGRLIFASFPSHSWLRF